MVEIPRYDDFRPEAVAISNAVRISLPSPIRVADRTNLHRGEAGWISIVRGITALLAVTAMLAFAAYELFFSPIAEAKTIPQRRYHITDNHDFLPQFYVARKWVVEVEVSLGNS